MKRSISCRCLDNTRVLSNVSCYLFKFWSTCREEGFQMCFYSLLIDIQVKNLKFHCISIITLISIINELIITRFYMCNPYQYFQTTCRKYIFESSLHFDKKPTQLLEGWTYQLFLSRFEFFLSSYMIFFFLHGSVSLYLLSLQKLIKSFLPQANIYFVDVIIKFRRNRQCHLSFELVYHS